MKKKIILVSILLVSIILTGATTRNDNGWTDNQTKAHEIAEIARGMGLEETDKIITRAQEIWFEEEQMKKSQDGTAQTAEGSEVEDIPTEDVPKDEVPIEEPKWYTDEDVRMVATTIYYEAWAGCSERHRELVGAVIVNRLNSSQFPNTIYEILVAPRQYNRAYATGAKRVPDFAWETCKELAIRALEGRVECPPNVLYQSEYPGLGTGEHYEVHRTSYSTTYFNFG